MFHDTDGVSTITRKNFTDKTISAGVIYFCAMKPLKFGQFLS